MRSRTIIRRGAGSILFAAVATCSLAIIRADQDVIGAPDSQESVRVPGTTTSLRPPEGFSVADRFPGFERADVQSSIMVTEIPTPAGDLVKAMTQQALAAQGMRLITSRTEMVAGRQAVLLHVAQNVGGTEFLKWMLITGDRGNAVMIVGTFPRGAEANVGAAIRSSVLSASWLSGGAVDGLDGLLFRVTPTPKLLVAGRVSNMLILTESGSMTSPDPARAIYIVGPSLGTISTGNLQAFSETRARQVTTLKDLSNVEGRPVILGDLPGYELVARATDVKTGVAMRLYQVIAPESGGYVIVQGLVGETKAADMIPEFRRLTATYQRTTPEGASRPVPR